ncbi:asparagine synthase [Microbacterium sp. HA-8]|uniref:asparagine synthase n=1 Tax=unclassified Microbacterium TaxID=2609290 RepID=UPI0025D85049|nr:asparagine synthase [Microbacterium sp.]
MSPKASSDAPEAVDSASGAAARAKRPKVADVVAEGLYIAVATTRLSLKNRILMDTIAGGEGYDVDRFLPDARAALLSLADEADEAADRVRREARDAWRRFADPDGTHDYGSRDVRNLRRRRRQSRKVAKELRARADDEDALRQIVVAARDAAWQELAANIDRTLRVEAARPDLEPDYARMREARMQSLRLVDLAALSSQQRQRAKVRGDQRAPDDAPGESD